MNKKLKYAVIGFVVLCVAYPGVAWLIGLRVEASIAKREKSTMDQFPGNATVISRHYQRGVFGATEELTYGVGPATLSALGPMAAALPDLAGWRITVRNTIHHGPLPQFRTIGLATISTDITLPPQLSAKLRQWLGGEPAFQIHSHLGWFGDTTTVVESPGYQGQLADGTHRSTGMGSKRLRPATRIYHPIHLTPARPGSGSSPPSCRPKWTAYRLAPI